MPKRQQTQDSIVAQVVPRAGIAKEVVLLGVIAQDMRTLVERETDDMALAAQIRRLDDRARMCVNNLERLLPPTQHTCASCGERFHWLKLSQAALAQTGRNVCVVCWMSDSKRGAFLSALKDLVEVV